MKNLIKILAMSLLVVLFGVVAVSTMLADPTEVQTPQTKIKFDVETGIRWYPDDTAFEIFNTNGIAYIASNVWVNIAGEVASDSASGFYRATPDARYKIMQDIKYTVPNIEANTRNEIKEFFSGSFVRRALTSTAIVYGRSCTLSNFPIVNGALLFESNAGTISNLRIEDPVFQTGGSGIGLIARTNSGTIDDCIIKEGSSILSVDNKSIGAIAYSSTGTIRSNINHLNIVSSGTYAAGIVANTIGGVVSNNTNHGSIEGDNASGIVALSDDNTKILSNANHGAIKGVTTACGILASNPPYNNDSNISANTNSVPPSCPTGETADIYIEPRVYPHGIYYYSPGVFRITTVEGLSYIGEDEFFDADGEKANGANSGQTTASSKYYIVKKITYDAQYFTSLIALEQNALVDGQNNIFEGFPIRKIGTTDTGAALFDTIPLGATVKNINLTTTTDTTIDFKAGILCYTNKGTIENCTVGTVSDEALSTTKPFGGIAAYAYSGVFIDCTMTASVFSAYNLFGGLVAKTYDDCVFIRCVLEKGVVIDITSNSFAEGVGGIVGASETYDGGQSSVFGGPPAIENIPGLIFYECFNYGSIIFRNYSSSPVYIGGILGWYESGGSDFDGVSFFGCGNLGADASIECFYFSSSLSEICVGGLAGYLHGYSDYEMRFVSTGNAVCKNEQRLVVQVYESVGWSAVGGIVGYFEYSVKVYRSPDFVSDLGLLVGGMVGVFDGGGTLSKYFVEP